MIEIKKLKKHYRGGTIALRGINLRIDKRLTCILGRNGAGKTTLLRILSTQLLPSSGQAFVNGYDVVKEAKKIRGMICSIPQEAKPSGLPTPFDHLFMYLTARGMTFAEATDTANKALRKLDLWRVRNTPSDDLSGGTKRKIFVAMALASNAEVIFLDEPTTGLDPISRLQVWAAIRTLKSQIILTTHYMEEAKELADDIILIDNGRVLARGTAQQLLRPFKNKVRIEGIGRYRVGGLSFSYANKNQAKRYIGKTVAIKPVDLEDLFITRGVNIED